MLYSFFIVKINPPEVVPKEGFALLESDFETITIRFNKPIYHG
jgi:hypothetical protein